MKKWGKIFCMFLILALVLNISIPVRAYSPDLCVGGTPIGNMENIGNAFDDNPATFAHSYTISRREGPRGEKETVYTYYHDLGYAFSSPKKVRTIRARFNGWYTPLKAYWSDDGVNWNEISYLHTYVEGKSDYVFPDLGSHKYWKINTEIDIYELEMLEIPAPSAQNGTPVTYASDVCSNGTSLGNMQNVGNAFDHNSSTFAHPYILSKRVGDRGDKETVYIQQNDVGYSFSTPKEIIGLRVLCNASVPATVSFRDYDTGSWIPITTFNLNSTGKYDYAIGGADAHRDWKITTTADIYELEMMDNYNPSVRFEGGITNGTTIAPVNGNNQLSVGVFVNDYNTGEQITIFYDMEGYGVQTVPGTITTSGTANIAIPPSYLATVGEGSRKLRVWCKDNRGGESEKQYIYLTLDRTAPVISAFNSSSTVDSITCEGMATDSVTGMSTSAYRFTNGTSQSPWGASAFSWSGLTPNTRVALKMEARDAVGNISTSATAYRYTKSSGASIAVSNVGLNTANIAITDVTPNPAGTEYQILCGTNGVDGNGNLTASGTWVSLGSKQFTLKGLSPSKSYSVQVKTRNAEGSESALSTSVPITTLSSPASITVENPTETTMDLKITDGLQNPSGTLYQIATKDGYIDGNGKISTTPTWITCDSKFIRVSGLLPNTPYTFVIKTKNSAGTASAPSTGVAGRTLSEKPGLTVTEPAGNSLTVNITGNNPAGTAYQISTGENNYVSSTGTIGSTPEWLVLDGKKLKVTGLLPNTGYGFAVKAKNAAGTETELSTVVKGRTLCNVPAGGTPSGITSSSLQAAWDPNQNPAETQYQLSVYDSANVLVKQSPWSTETKATISGLSAKTAYRLSVKAKNGLGVETVAYEMGTVSTLPNPPLSPANLGVTATANTVTLTWDPVGGATSYTVNADGKIIEKITEPRYSDINLGGNTSHIYSVSAVNEGGSSVFCTAVTAKTLPDAPKTPANLKLASSKKDELTLAWDASEAATEYLIKVDGVSYSAQDKLTFVKNGLDAGSKHTFSIAAVNSGGVSPWSEDVIAYTRLDTPNELVLSATNNKVVLSWDPVKGATGYEISCGTTTLSTTVTNYTINDLKPNTEYPIRIKAKNEVTVSDWTEERTKNTLPNPPEVPSGIQAKAETCGIQLSWDPIDGATGYEIEVNGQIQNTMLNNSYSDQGLQPGETYKYRVRARNAGGKSGWSTYVMQTTLAIPADVPAELKTASTMNSLTLTWKKVPSCTSYDVEVDGVVHENIAEEAFKSTELTVGEDHVYRVRSNHDDAKSEWSTPIKAAAGNSDLMQPKGLCASSTAKNAVITWAECSGAISYEVYFNGAIIKDVKTNIYLKEELQGAMIYTYKVRAVYADGTSLWSEEKIVLTKPNPLEPITGITVTLASSDCITVNWSPNPEASTYDLMVDGKIHEDLKDLSYTENGLQPTTEHTFCVRGKSEETVGEWSAPLVVKTTSDKPEVPTFAQTLLTNQTIEIRWNVVKDATAYEYQIDGEPITETLCLFVKVEGLLPKTGHTIKVRTKRGSEFSEWKEFTGETKPNAPIAPAFTKLSTTSDAISAQWNAVTDAKTYDVKIDGTLVTGLTDTTFTKKELTPNSQHTLLVRAVNDGGLSPWSTEAVILTRSESPNVPSNLIATQDVVTVNVSWDEVPGASAYEVNADGRLVNVGEAHNFTDSNLEHGTKHTYQVRSVNGEVPSEWTAIIEKIIPLQTPALEFSTKGTSVTISWNEVPKAESYLLELDGKVVTVEGTKYVQSNLKANSKHTYRILAKNSITESPWSEKLERSTAGITYTFNAVNGEEIEITVNAEKKNDFSMNTFTLSYDEKELQVLDLCALTEAAELEAGKIDGTSITIIKVGPGIISFRYDGAMSPGEAFTGLVNLIRFKALKDGEIHITLSDL